MSRFFVTTPIYYVNDKPHIGHAYTTTVADVLNRYHRLFGDETKFVTGVDEHGQKVQAAAKAREVSPQAHCDSMAPHFQEVWKELNIDYDVFFRTTSDFHKQAVQACLQQLFDQGDIYANEYEGWYSVSEEIFYTEKDLVNGKSPQGRDVTLIKEKNYFFKMSKYQDRLIQYIEQNPSFLQPDNRKNEVLGFLRQPLQDLSISRPKARLSWGIDLPFDPEHVTYVWFDALLNYATAVGLKRPGMEDEFKKWWDPQSGGGVLHLIGKDILVPHAVYWPTMLMALNLPLPVTIFAHGWWLNSESEKMSKSTGTAISPLQVKDVVGVDEFRYFLLRDIQFGNDASFSTDLVVSRVNSELANNLGNLFSRTTNLIDKYFEGKFPELIVQEPESLELKEKALAVAKSVKREILSLAPHKALQQVVDLLTDCNRYLETRAPWKAIKENISHAQESLTTSLEVIRITAVLLGPVMPKKIEQLLGDIGCSELNHFASAQQWGLIPKGARVCKGTPLFPRIQPVDTTKS